MTAKVLETAISKASRLPEATQERIGRDLLAHIDALERLRSDLQIGIDQLDAGLGREVDIETLIGDADRKHAER